MEGRLDLHTDTFFFFCVLRTGVVEKEKRARSPVVLRRRRDHPNEAPEQVNGGRVGCLENEVRFQFCLSGTFF